MTDPEVGRLNFVAVIGRNPTPVEMPALMSAELTRRAITRAGRVLGNRLGAQRFGLADP